MTFDVVNFLQTNGVSLIALIIVLMREFRADKGDQAALLSKYIASQGELQKQVTALQKSNEEKDGKINALEENVKIINEAEFDVHFKIRAGRTFGVEGVTMKRTKELKKV